MRCAGFGQNGCIYPISKESPWNLCVSCTKIVNRHFLVETMRYLETNNTTGHITLLGSFLDIRDFSWMLSIFERIELTPGFKDPRLTFLFMVEAKMPSNFKDVARAFLKQSGFITSLTLFYKQHLPYRLESKLVCRTLWKLFKISGLDPQSFPVCPHCFARVAETYYRKENVRAGEIPRKLMEILKFYSAGRQSILWKEGIKRCLEMLWMEKKANDLNWVRLGEALQQAIPDQQEFSELILDIIKNPVFLEYVSLQTLNKEVKLLFEIWSGETLNVKYIKKVLKARSEIYKEDLMIKTWHPSRLFKWCLDLEDLHDFAPITAEDEAYFLAIV
jgi:hypothetical protein